LSRFGRLVCSLGVMNTSRTRTKWRGLFPSLTWVIRPATVGPGWQGVAHRGDRGGMRTNRRRAILLVAGLGLLAACTSSAEEAVDSTTTTEVVTTTTEAPVTTQTTLSEFEIEQAALAEAEAEITAAIEGWYTYPVDTSLGEAGLPLEFITGAVEQRLIDLAQARIAAGEIQRSRGGDTIEIFEIRVDHGRHL